MGLGPNDENTLIHSIYGGFFFSHGLELLELLCYLVPYYKCHGGFEFSTHSINVSTKIEVLWSRLKLENFRR